MLGMLARSDTLVDLVEHGGDETIATVESQRSKSERGQLETQIYSGCTGLYRDSGNPAQRRCPSSSWSFRCIVNSRFCLL